MKNIFVFILIISLFTSCSNSNKMKDLENRITTIENQNKILMDSLKSVNAEFLKPFKIYRKIVLSELKKSPNQIISDYEFLIKNYPNSFWQHEAKKRMENIETRKKYWSVEEGWKLPKKIKKPELTEIIEITTISCPGC
jgi:uncharacterized FlgJ-related protein